MKLTAWIAALALATKAGIAVAAATAVDVRIDSGRLQGRLDGTLATFQGIRYAAPPVGERRWRAPASVAPWPGVEEAKAPGASCIQKPQMSIDNGGGDVRPIGEDCLFLNVWTPATEPSARLPVMVWIHGGALVFGSGGVPVYNGAPLAARGAVVVTLNYRLGTLGFFAHPSVTPPGGDINFGLLDQVTALHWVQRNIEAFGGDPGNVTVFGQSAGAMSVLALFASPLAKGLFHKGIAQSPYGLPSHTPAKARGVAANVASALRLDGANATADQLRAVPAEAFASLNGRGESLTPSFVFGDRALPQPILDAFQQGNEAPVPLIIGSTSDDASVAVAFGMDPAAIVQRLGVARVAVRSLYPADLTDAQLGRQTARDLVFTAFARRIAYLHSARAPTWRYYYGKAGDTARATPNGVAHGADVPYTMGTAADCQCLGAPATAQDRAAAERTSQRWFDFAATGTPVPRDADLWPRDGRRDARLLELGETDTVRPDYMKRRLDAFIGVLKAAGALTRAR